MASGDPVTKRRRTPASAACQIPSPRGGWHVTLVVTAAGCRQACWCFAGARPKSAFLQRPALLPLQGRSVCLPLPIARSTATAPAEVSPEEKAGVAEAEPDQPAEMVGPQPIYRKDYKPTSYLVPSVQLTFKLGEQFTIVTSDVQFVPNYSGSSPPELVLNGTVLSSVSCTQCGSAAVAALASA